jgi:UDP-3-O-[3-hydroxymyristoyl] glucosamine N-acyltransferase
MEFTINQVAVLLGGEVKGNGKKGQIAFLSNPKYEQYIYTTKASAVIVKKDFQPKKDIESTLILVEDPYTSFTALLEEYHKMITFQKVGVEQPSYMSENSTVGVNVYRGAFSYIGSNSRIGNNVKIYPNVYIGDDVVIGDNTILYAGVKVYHGARIGRHCVIHSGTVLGSDGFGFAPQDDGTYKTIPQLGNVVLEDNVAIGANTVIDCATLFGDSTIIRQGVKLDNLIQVAHNVEIGKNTVIAAQTGISGSTKIGENCIIGGQVGIGGHITVANRTGIGAQSGVAKSTKEGQRYNGTPAIDLREWFQSYAVFKNLPKLQYRIRELENKLKEVEGEFKEK